MPNHLDNGMTTIGKGQMRRMNSSLIEYYNVDFPTPTVAAGELIEKGPAILNPINRNKWTYTSARNNTSQTGCIIPATAKDTPENKASLERVLP
ncbi:hypothetical protein [Flavihumibacter sp. CACIAM 22H1]|uniref:hypothetical protein n=1 Tax=Flavihumibacter sp. CACIAM 22H1 TaxID=1812911 RepID=UPI0007A86A21|nr:hypothetical protein [Flavihumibacter sp. CACIAM 22H1]KYP13479.1 MAG: hypothetical protein A1D16_12335 [Flavihumibacter sp. CACIAM 22H1]